MTTDPISISPNESDDSEPLLGPESLHEPLPEPADFAAWIPTGTDVPRVDRPPRRAS